MKRTFVLGVAALALVAAGCGSSEEKKPSQQANTGAGTTSNPPPATAGGGKTTDLKIAADPSGALKFDKTSLSAKTGKVSITMDNPSSVPHGVGIEGNGVDEEGQVVNKGGVSKVSATLKPGKYEFYCPVPGHKQGGMEGTLTVK